MRIVRFVIFISVCLVFLMSTNAISKEVPDFPPLIDLAQLNLKVSNVEVVDEIKEELPETTTISVRKGWKIYVVTLQGTVTNPCKIITTPTEFSAIFEMPMGDFVASVTKSSFALAVNSGKFSSIKSDITNTLIVPIKEPGSVTFKVAFSFQHVVNSFFVCYPRLVDGKVTIPWEQKAIDKKTAKYASGLPVLEELHNLVDLAQFNLEVTNIEVVNKINKIVSFQAASFSAPKGHKLFIVTLEGKLAKSCEISMAADAFTAFSTDKKYTIAVSSSALAVNSRNFTIVKQGHSIGSLNPIRAGSIIFKTAFILPKDITGFFVGYPTLAKGKATIPSVMSD